jgi:2-succinyl-5-enolpyruvyl-6-hydroxy-3-cyclohexene-1-carboxylate synthase
MKLSTKKVVPLILAGLREAGVKDVIITPGSRNAPFIISITECPEFELYSIVDERSAAFFALGLAQQKHAPVALICTSGTALLNYSPAVAEAFYQRLPLVVISADRPDEWIDKGEGQSIRQRNVFTNIVDAEMHCSMEENDEVLAAMSNELAKVLSHSIRYSGPVHVNVPFREPLYHLEDAELPVFPHVSKQLIEDAPACKRVVDFLKDKKRIVVLLGQHHFPNFNAEVEQFNTLSQVLILNETQSNVYVPNAIPCIDQFIAACGERIQEVLNCDVLITVGTNIISRKVKAVFRKNKPYHIQVGLNEAEMDTFLCLKNHLRVSPKYFFEQASQVILSEGNYKQEALAIYTTSKSQIEASISSLPYSDLTVFDTIQKSIPNQVDVQMGNSSVVRYIQLFDQRADLRYFGNRGVAGIDGCTSTAVGAAYASQRETLLISGELSFMYDSNAFWNNYLSSKLKVIVINNGGGGIFRIIEGPKQVPQLERFFETAHNRSVKGMVQSFGIDYLSASSLGELSEMLPLLFAKEQAAVLEVFTPAKENASVLNTYFELAKVEL